LACGTAATNPSMYIVALLQFLVVQAEAVFSLLEIGRFRRT
jgi:hypothetical protein